MDSKRKNEVIEITTQFRHGLAWEFTREELREAAAELIRYCDNMDSVPVEKCSKCGKPIE